jgi:hypothetical protein
MSRALAIARAILFIYWLKCPADNFTLIMDPGHGTCPPPSIPCNTGGEERWIKTKELPFETSDQSVKVAHARARTTIVQVFSDLARCSHVGVSRWRAPLVARLPELFFFALRCYATPRSTGDGCRTIDGLLGERCLGFDSATIV